MTNPFSKNQLLWPLLFVALSILASLVRFAPFLVGKLNFTLFDLYAPVAGGWFGAILGPVLVFTVALVNLTVQHSYNLASILHLFPAIFGAWYFASHKRAVALIPLLAIFGFWMTSISRTVWYYPLFWLIPIVVVFFKDRFLVLNALGATFTAHAVGGVLWLYFFAPPAPVWINLIPIVIVERLIFASASVIAYGLVKKGVQIAKLYKFSFIK